MHELRQRIDALSRQVDQLAAADAATRQELMQQNWRGLQDYLGWMRGKWGTGSPWMLGTDPVQRPAWLTCPALGGSGAPWLTPEATSPEQYAQQMREPLRRSREQLDQLAQTQDPQRRQRLVQEHWHTLYRDLQTLRGLGWMWGGSLKSRDALGPGLSGLPGTGQAALPDPASPGAGLVSDYCTQCHAAPAPTLHTSEEWSGVFGRMHRNIERLPGIRVPSDEQMAAILAYMQQHAR